LDKQNLLQKKLLALPSVDVAHFKIKLAVRAARTDCIGLEWADPGTDIIALSFEVLHKRDRSCFGQNHVAGSYGHDATWLPQSPDVSEYHHIFFIEPLTRANATTAATKTKETRTKVFHRLLLFRFSVVRVFVVV
jgi:hypothetical protein